MELELGRATSPEVSRGISTEALDRLDRDIESVHRRIRAGIEDDAVGFAALGLPERSNPDAIRARLPTVSASDPVIVIGMGGSALGARAMSQALAPHRSTIVLDTIDPQYLIRQLDAIDLERAAVHIVSKSGQTIETRAVFRTLESVMDDAGVDWTARTVATVPDDGPIGSYLADNGVTRFDPPGPVPGRYSVLSTMALPSALMLDIDVEGLLEGGKRAVDGLEPSLYSTPAYGYGAIMAGLAARGVGQNVFIPYREDLNGLAHWFAQLWAESLGKDGLGQTPIVGRGPADHHSQLQRWRSGPADIAVTTVNIEEAEEFEIPADGRDLAGLGLDELATIERQAMEASLAMADRPTVRFDLEALTPETLGELFVTLQVACITYAELTGVNPFDQPAVEWAKTATTDAVAGRSSEHTAAIGDDPILRIPK